MMGKLTDKQKEVLQAIYDDDSEILVKWIMDRWGHKKMEAWSNGDRIHPTILKKLIEDDYLKPLEQCSDRDYYILSNKAIEVVDKDCWKTDIYEASPDIDELSNIDSLAYEVNYQTDFDNN